MSKFSFLEPLFKYIDSGKLFRQPLQFIYYAIGILVALYVLYRLADVYDMASYIGGVYYLYAVLMTLVAIAAAIFTVLFWFRRSGDLIKDMPENARFQAIPAVSNLVITAGEWFGLVGAGVTFCAGIFGAILLPWNSYNVGEAILDMLAIAVIGPIVSYLLLLLFRLIGEQILALGVIANKTNRIAHNTEK